MLLKEMQREVVDSDSCDLGCGSCKHGNKFLGFIKDEELLDLCLKERPPRSYYVNLLIRRPFNDCYECRSLS
jgi:hypothetical protein